MIRILRRIADSLRYWRLWLATPPGKRYIPLRVLPKAPVCWVRGHSWERAAGFSVSQWLLEFCTCCGQEVAWRTSLDDLRGPETDEEAEWAMQERELRLHDEDVYRDADGAYADWDAMRDHADANS